MSLHLDYRPRNLKEIIGNEETILKLEAQLANPDGPHVFLFSGPRGCLHGNTKIYDPVDNTNLSIKDRWKLGLPFNVFSYSSDGSSLVTKAQPPVQYPEDRMFRVETSESVFYVTSEHRFLSDTGQYLSLKELNAMQYDQVRLVSISESCLKVQHQDELRYLRIKEDFLGRYQNDLHSYDAQLLLSLMDDLISCSSLDGVFARILDYLPSDCQDIESEYNRTYQQYGHLSKQGSFFLEDHDDFLYEFLSFLKNDECSDGHNQISNLNLFEKNLFYIKMKLIHRLFEKVFSNCKALNLDLFYKLLSAYFSLSCRVNTNESLTSTSIKEITEVCKEKYYDFHVPVYNNYWSGGVFHHNCGKTTLARIASKIVDCDERSLQEIDVGTNRGIDNAKELKNGIMFSPMFGKVKAYILDEVHQGTPAYFNALLKTLEDTPKHVYFFLCTTDPQKLLTTVKSRCSPYQVNALTQKEIVKLLEWVIEEEQANFKPEELKRISEVCEGIPREALIILDQVIDLAPTDRLKAIESTKEREHELKELCQALLNGKSWKVVAPILKGLKAEPESIRHGVLGYMNSVLLNGNESAAIIMEEFRTPCYTRSDLTLSAYMSLK